MSKHGGYGPSSVQKVRKPRPKPKGQCQSCFASGLSHAQSRKLCPACR